MGRNKINRIYESNHNTYGTLMKIIEYVDANNILVEFQDEHKVRVRTKYNTFIKGNIKNPYDKEVYERGYIGIGKYKTRENNKHTRIYKTWQSMMQRCYDPYFLNKELTYIDCFVCEEWHCFQNFAEWYENNAYNCNNERMHLDKDILVKGNKIYSPETCMLVPQRINSLFTKSDTIRGKYPIGVSYKNGNLVARCNIIVNDEGKRKHLGYFPLNRPFQAFTCYKKFKENYIKQVAEEYKTLIPNKLYNAMYKWEVEIND